MLYVGKANSKITCSQKTAFSRKVILKKTYDCFDKLGVLKSKGSSKVANLQKVTSSKSSSFIVLCVAS